MARASDERIRSLYAALGNRSAGATDTEIVWNEVSIAAFSVRITSPRGPVAVMQVSNDGVTVTTRSGGLHRDAGETEIVDTLGINLRVDFSWDDVLSETADQLAQLLIKHMRRRIRESDPEPRTEERAALN
jgi:hypothetical protein